MVQYGCVQDETESSFLSADHTHTHTHWFVRYEQDFAHCAHLSAGSTMTSLSDDAKSCFINCQLLFHKCRKIIVLCKVFRFVTHCTSAGIG